MFGSLLNKVAGLQGCNFIKKRLQHRCFPVNIVKFLRTAILKNACERLLLISIIALRFVMRIYSMLLSIRSNCYKRKYGGVLISHMILLHLSIFQRETIETKHSNKQYSKKDYRSNLTHYIKSIFTAHSNLFNTYYSSHSLENKTFLLPKRSNYQQVCKLLPL